MKRQVCKLEIDNNIYLTTVQMGYKELCIHMASVHGGLERVLANDSREEMRALLLKIKQ